MRARWTLNLVLLILVAGLDWAVLRDLREAEESIRLTGMDPAHIEGVELVRPGRDTLRLERVTGGGWRMTAPYRIGADPQRVARLLAVVQAPVVRSFPASGVDLQGLGLEPDPVRISLGGQTLRFGGTEPIDGLRYVGSADLVFLIQDVYYHLLTAPASDYVDPHPLAAGSLPTAGDLDGEALDGAALTAIAAVKAERVEPLDGDLNGHILTIRLRNGQPGEGAALRFLVSPDGLRWSRPDLRLTYLVASPPPFLVDQETPAVAEGPAAARSDLGALPEQAVGLVEGAGPPPAEQGAESGSGPDEPGPAAERSAPAVAGSAEPMVDPQAPMEMRVEHLRPEDHPDAAGGEELDPVDARQRQIDDAVSASFGGPPVRSQAQLRREETGADDGEAIVTPEQASRPPPAVKLRP